MNSVHYKSTVCVKPRMFDVCVIFSQQKLTPHWEHFDRFRANFSQMISLAANAACVDM